MQFYHGSMTSTLFCGNGVLYNSFMILLLFYHESRALKFQFLFISTDNASTAVWTRPPLPVIVDMYLKAFVRGVTTEYSGFNQMHQDCGIHSRQGICASPDFTTENF